MNVWCDVIEAAEAGFAIDLEYIEPLFLFEEQFKLLVSLVQKSLYLCHPRTIQSPMAVVPNELGMEIMEIMV